MVAPSGRAGQRSTAVAAAAAAFAAQQATSPGCRRLAAALPSGSLPAKSLRVARPAQEASSPRVQRRPATLAALAAAAAAASVGRRPARAAATVRVHGVDGKEVVVPGARTDTRVSHALDKIKWPAKWPYGKGDFSRLDCTDDALFYDSPKLVRHVDDPGLQALTDYYRAVFPKDREFSAMDYCSSWVSHYPEQPRPTRFAITGMNEEELVRNAQATEHAVRDLNQDPRLPYDDAQFDVVTNTVSVDYLTQPLEVFKEVSRVLKPGGLATVAFSNRCFLTKVVGVWSSGDDEDRAEIISNYFHFAGGFADPEVVDISPNPKSSDPMCVVSAVRTA